MICPTTGLRAVRSKGFPNRFYDWQLAQPVLHADGREPMLPVSRRKSWWLGDTGAVGGTLFFPHTIPRITIWLP